MGYNFTIGEATVENIPADPEFDENVQSEYCHLTAETVRLDDAPAFGEPTDYTNERWPGYAAWYDFCEAVDLLPAFYYIDEHHNTGDIRGGHPGIFPITKAFKEEIDNAYNNWKELFPDVKATYDSDKIEDKYMCRLEWLKYWTDWALENCKNPVFANS